MFVCLFVLFADYKSSFGTLTKLTRTQKVTSWIQHCSESDWIKGCTICTKMKNYLSFYLCSILMITKLINSIIIITKAYMREIIAVMNIMAAWVHFGVFPDLYFFLLSMLFLFVTFFSPPTLRWSRYDCLPCCNALWDTIPSACRSASSTFPS